MTTLNLSLLPALLMGAATLSAQTAAPTPKAPVHHTATPAATTAHKPTAATTVAGPAACAKDVPVLSPKIPALPAGTPCVKALMTFTTTPNIKLSYISPLVTPEVREGLGLDPTSFSLDYSEVKVGTGELGLPHKYYTVHYTGYLLDGTKFDSSVDRNEPFVFPVGAHRVIPGWDLGLQGMHTGGKRRLYIPWQLAYGDKGQPPSIPGRAALIFDIELISQSDNPPAPKTPPTPPAPKPTTMAPATTPSAAPAEKPATPAPAAEKPATPAPATSATPTPAPKL